MISNEKDFVNYIDHLLHQHGYVKKATSWYLSTKECVCFFSILKSPYGGYYEEIMGVVVKSIYDGKKEFPPFKDNHFHQSFQDFGRKAPAKRAFNLEDKTFIENKRELLIEKLLTSITIPFLRKIGSKRGILELYHQNTKLRNWMDIDLRRLLKIPDDAE